MRSGAEDGLKEGRSAGEDARSWAWQSVERADLPVFIGQDGKGRLRFRGNCIRRESAIVEEFGLEGYVKTRLGYRSKPGSELRTPEEMKESGLWDHAQRRVTFGRDGAHGGSMSEKTARW